MAAPHRITCKGHELRVWGLKLSIAVSGFDAVLECGTCHTQFTMKVLEELAGTRASKNIGTPDVHCCTLPPSTVRGSSNIRDLLRQCCGIQTATPPAQPAATSPAPTHRIYRLDHCGETFCMHGIASCVVNSALSCNICKREFPLEVVAAMLDIYKDSRCRDITCCQHVKGALGGVGDLGVFANRHSAPQSPEPKPMCRWCKGTGRVTLLTTSKPCDCVKDAVGGAEIGAGWKVKHVFNGLA